MYTEPGNREQLLALLSELKVMTNLGSHLNILNVLGAVTSDLDKGKLQLRRTWTRVSYRHVGPEQR